MRSCKPGPGTLGEHMIKARNSERQPEELYLDTATLVAHVQAENDWKCLNKTKVASHGISTEGPAGSVMALRLMGGPPPCRNEDLNLELVDVSWIPKMTAVLVAAFKKKMCSSWWFAVL